MSGLWFEEFKDGMVFNHEWSRTITETDNVWFSLLTMNVQPLHIDAHYAAKSEWGKPLVNSLFTLGLLIGMSVNDTTFGTTLANLGMTDVRFPKPLFQGDSVKARTTVRAKRESKSRPNEGIVTFFHEMMNQDGVVVANGGSGGSYLTSGHLVGQNGQLNDTPAVGYYDGGNGGAGSTVNGTNGGVFDAGDDPCLERIALFQQLVNAFGIDTFDVG